MIYLHDVTDTPLVFGAKEPLLVAAELLLPKGRYALMSRKPERHRALIDVITALRPPATGIVRHDGLVSWPIGRQGFARGKATGRQMMNFVCALYGIDVLTSNDFVSDLLTAPEYLARPMEHWPLYMRQEFSFALALLPDFDVYFIEGAIPFEPCRFTRLWLALFEERLVGRTLLLSTYRHQQMMDYCTKGLVYEQHSLRIDDDLDGCLRKYHVRRSRSGPADGGEDPAVDVVERDQLDI